MIIILSKEEIKKIIENRIRAQGIADEGSVTDVDIVFQSGELVGVVGVNEVIPDNYYEDSETDFEDSSDDQPEDTGNKTSGKKSGKRKRRTKAEIEAAKAAEEAEVAEPEKPSEEVAEVVKDEPKEEVEESDPFAIQNDADAAPFEVDNVFGNNDVPVTEVVETSKEGFAKPADDGATDNPFAQFS